MTICNFSQLDLERAHFLLNEALDEDEQNETEEAIKLYSEAISLCIHIVSHECSLFHQM